MKPRYLPTTRHLLPVATTLVTLFASSAVQAAVETWTGTTHTWNTSGNWTGTNLPPISDDSIIFGAAGAGGLLLNNDLTSSSFNLAGITFNAGAPAYVIGDGTTSANAGNTFVLTGNVTNSSTSLQTLNTPFSMTAVRTFTTTTGGGNLTLTGVISGTGGINKAGLGTLTLSGANTYNGVTSFATGGTAGTLVATTLADGGVSGVGTANSLGLSSNAASNLLLGGGTTLRYTGPAASTDRSFTMNANTNTQVFTLDASGTGAIQFTNTASPAFEASSTRTHTLNLSGSNTGDNIFAANVANAGTGATTLTKTGSGTWVLTGTNHSHTGGTFANRGTLKVAAGSGALLSSSLTFGSTGTAGSAGGTFIYDSSGASGDLSQTMGALASTPSLAADNTLQVTGNASHNTTLTFSSVTNNASENGNTINFVVAGSGAINGTNTKIVFSSASGTTTAAAYNYAAITSQTAYFNGGQFAVYDTTGFVRGINYGTDTKSSEFNGTAITGTGATTNAKVTGSITGQGTATLGTATAGTNGTLLIPGSFDITQTGGTTLTLAGPGNAGTYGILKTGGTLSTPSASTISGGTLAFSSGAQTDIRVDTAYDTLTIGSALTQNGSVRFMKSGAGTLILSGGNLTLPAFNQFINGGVLEFGGSGTFSFAGTTKTMVIAPGALFRYNSTSTTSSIAQPIVGSGGVSVNNGILTLTGANTYSGTTTVTSGTLKLNSGGSIANSTKIIVGEAGSSGAVLDVTTKTGGFAVSSGQTLSGTGTLSGNTTISAGAIHAPTAQVSDSRQTFSNSLTYATGSIFEWDLTTATADSNGTTPNQGSYSQVRANGTSGAVSGSAIFRLVLDSSSSFENAFWDTNKSWDNIFTGTGAPSSLTSLFGTTFDATGGLAANGTVAGQGQFSYGGTTLNWTAFTAVPEPSSVLAGLLLGAGLLRRRRC